MTAVPPQQNPQQPSGAPAPAPSQPQTPTLPPTGLQQSLASIQQMQAQAQSQGIQTAQAGSTPLPGVSGATGSTTSIQSLVDKLQSQYGLSVGRGSLFDDEGNPQMTPEQVADASGGAETMGTAAAKMNMIADAISNRKTQEAQGRAQDALAAGAGLVQSRARGSLAALQSGLYQNMANLYANQEYEAADFNFYIQREQQMIEAEYRRKAEEKQKKSARFGSIVGAIGLIAAPFTGGATLGIAAQGLGQVGNTGWI